jgi:hypothetical protein
MADVGFLRVFRRPLFIMLGYASDHEKCRPAAMANSLAPVRLAALQGVTGGTDRSPLGRCPYVSRLMVAILSFKLERSLCHCACPGSRSERSRAISKASR